ncbi:hypothetical protein Tco_0885840 [Tanacetum coccineum]
MDSAASLRSCLASKIKSIDGTIKAKDGKPMKAFRNVSFEASKPDGVQSKPKQSFASKVKNQTNTRAVHIQKVSNDTVIPGAHVAIPIEAIDEVSSRFENTLYGYFIGKRLAFSLVEN